MKNIKKIVEKVVLSVSIGSLLLSSISVADIKASADIVIDAGPKEEINYEPWVVEVGDGYYPVIESFEEVVLEEVIVVCEPEEPKDIVINYDFDDEEPAKNQQESSNEQTNEQVNEIVEPAKEEKKEHICKGEWVVEAEATCKNDGMKKCVCAECKAVLEIQTIPKTGHSYNVTVEKEPTYTAKGINRNECVNCGYTYFSAIPILTCENHDFEEVGVVKEPTYKEKGIKKLRCRNCYIEEFEDIEKLDVKSDPTHVHEFEEGEQIKEATCTAYGKKSLICKTCGEIEYEVIPMDPDNHKDVLRITEVDPDDAKKSIIHNTCRDCGYTEDEYVYTEGRECEHLITSQKKVEGSESGKSEIWFYCQVCDKLLSKVGEYQNCLHVGLGTYVEVVNEGNATEERVVATHCGNCHEVLNTVTYPPYSTVEVELKDGNTQEVYGYYDEELSKQVFEQLNEYRVANGLNALNWSNEIEQYADTRAAEAAVLFDHERPNGERFYSLDRSRMNGENLALGYSSANTVMTAWKNSPGHNENMLYPTFKSVAVSCFVEYRIGSNGKVTKTYYITQNFSVYR